MSIGWTNISDDIEQQHNNVRIQKAIKRNLYSLVHMPILITFSHLGNYNRLILKNLENRHNHREENINSP